jgi:hypothetical protein
MYPNLFDTLRLQFEGQAQFSYSRNLFGLKPGDQAGKNRQPG